jgi:hypothetical protein
MYGGPEQEAPHLACAKDGYEDISHQMKGPVDLLVVTPEVQWFVGFNSGFARYANKREFFFDSSPK